MRDKKERTPLLTATPSSGASTAPATLLSSMYRWFDSWDYWHFDIHEVCKNGDYAALRRFVDTHTDRAQLKALVNRPDSLKLPPFYYLTRADDKGGTLNSQLLACAQLLLELGANPYFDEYGESTNALLKQAILRRPSAMAALLVQYGAKIDEVKALSTGGPLAAMPEWTEKIEEIKRLSKTALDFKSTMEEEPLDEDYAAYQASITKKVS